jgi:hypothetical protein
MGPRTRAPHHTQKQSAPCVVRIRTQKVVEALCTTAAVPHHGRQGAPVGGIGQRRRRQRGQRVLAHGILPAGDCQVIAPGDGRDAGRAAGLMAVILCAGCGCRWRWSMT